MSSLDKVAHQADAVKPTNESEAARANMSHEAFSSAKDQIILSKPGSACIRDPQGYIECGPIVGYPRPDANPAENPSTPGTGELKKFFEVPASPDFPKLPKFHYDPQTEKLLRGPDPSIRFPQGEMMDIAPLKKN
jgi:hypothetical protein